MSKLYGRTIKTALTAGVMAVSTSACKSSENPPPPQPYPAQVAQPGYPQQPTQQNPMGALAGG